MSKHTTFVAASATAVLSALLLMPPFAPPASAQECQDWEIPFWARIDQSNGWWVVLDSPTAARSGNSGGGKQMDGAVAFQPNQGNNVKFTITWDNGSGGIYTGQIDPNGFVSGRTADKWHPESTADWHMWNTAKCLSWK